jgi:hypothetical protein
VDPVATILIPTHDHGPTLRASIASALAQTCPVEVFIIGDGVPQETRLILAEFPQTGHSLRFFDHPKGPRNGEAYRHAALQEAKGRIVCYLSDDDLYFPDHVQVMSHLLEDADFAHALPVEVRLDGSLFVRTVDLEFSVFQRELLEGRNRIPLSCGAHTLSAYRELEQGWSTTPLGELTDLYMWCKFLRHPGFRFKAATTPTFLGFPAQPRKHHTGEQRYQELQSWLDQLNEESAVARLSQRILAEKVLEATILDARLIEATRDGFALTVWQCPLKVYFPCNGGYDEARSASFPMRFQTWRTIVVDIPCPECEFQIRIDPAEVECLIELAKIEVITPGGILLWRLTESNAHTVQVGGTAVSLSRGLLIRVISDGNDPQLQLPPMTAPPGTETVRLEFRVRLDADVRTFIGLLGTYLRS